MTEQITREVNLPATPAEVWHALTDRRWLESWLADSVALDLAPGGDARFIVNGEPREGWVEEARPPSATRPGLLAFWWQAADQPASRVTLEVSGAGHGTRLRVVEARPLELLDLVGVPLAGPGRGSPGPSLIAA
jgi:uncharacterized protein YndB with AHSA1/START domain